MVVSQSLPLQVCPIDDEWPQADLLVTVNPDTDGDLRLSGADSNDKLELPSVHRPRGLSVQAILLAEPPVSYSYWFQTLKLASTFNHQQIVCDFQDWVRLGLGMPNRRLGSIVLACRDFLREEDQAPTLTLLDRNGEVTRWFQILDKPGPVPEGTRALISELARKLLHYDFKRDQVPRIVATLRALDHIEACRVVLNEHRRYFEKGDFDFTHRGLTTSRLKLDETTFKPQKLSSWIPGDFHRRIDPRMQALYWQPETEAWRKLLDSEPKLMSDLQRKKAWVATVESLFSTAQQQIPIPALHPTTESTEYRPPERDATIWKEHLPHYIHGAGATRMKRGGWPDSSAPAKPPEPCTLPGLTFPKPAGLSCELHCAGDLPGGRHWKMAMAGNSLYAWTSDELEAWVRLPQPVRSLPPGFYGPLCPLSESRVYYSNNWGRQNHVLYDTARRRELFQTLDHATPARSAWGNRVAFRVEDPVPDTHTWQPKLYSSWPNTFNDREKWAVVDSETGICRALLPPGEVPALSADGRWVALAGNTTVAVFDVEKRSFREMEHSGVWGFHFLPDSVLVCADNKFRYWAYNLTSGDLVTTFQDPNERITSRCLGRGLLCGEHRKLSVAAFSPFRELYTKENLTAMEMSLDGRWLVAVPSGQVPGSVFFILRACDGQVMGNILVPDSDKKFCFSADGNWLGVLLTDDSQRPIGSQALQLYRLEEKPLTPG